MDDQANYLTAGTLVTFTSGEYSDYSMHGTFVALETVSFEQANELAKEITAKQDIEVEKNGWYDGDVHLDFQSACIKRGWLLEVNNTERHIGSYSYLAIE
jgi:hypothetical protein